MKAFLIILVILVILAGVVFYFGWVQIHLPAEHYAVVFTKSGGYDQEVIRPGEFSWRWERLIPTNMTLYIFDLHPRSREISFQGSLPSAELYSSVLPENPDFSYRGEIEVIFAVAPESLPALVAEEKLLPDQLDDFYSAQAGALSDSALETLQETDADPANSGALNRLVRQELTAAAEKIDIGESGIIALDWLNGRRTPDANQALKGALMGLNLGSDAPRIFRALVEATVFGSKKIADRFISEGVRIDGVIALGGVARKSPFVMQVMADALNMTIKVAKSEQTVALGAAMFAAVVAGLYKDVETAQEAMGAGFDTVYEPIPENAEKYRALYEAYNRLGQFIEKETPEH